MILHNIALGLTQLTLDPDEALLLSKACRSASIVAEDGGETTEDIFAVMGDRVAVALALNGFAAAFEAVAFAAELHNEVPSKKANALTLAAVTARGPRWRRSWTPEEIEAANAG